MAHLKLVDFIDTKFDSHKEVFVVLENGVEEPLNGVTYYKHVDGSNWPPTLEIETIDFETDKFYDEEPYMCDECREDQLANKKKEQQENTEES